MPCPWPPFFSCQLRRMATGALFHGRCMAANMKVFGSRPGLEGKLKKAPGSIMGFDIKDTSGGTKTNECYSVAYCTQPKGNI